MDKQFTFITTLTSEQAMDLLLKSSQYQNFELPEYFDFDNILNFVREKIGDKRYEDCVNGANPGELDDVNFDIVLNKDGKYAIRPLSLCNPYLYYFLAREVCGKQNWEQIKEHFSQCSVKHIKCCAMPVLPNERKENFHNATTILNWWNAMEQRAIELSLEYRYMFVTDITNCYGSINPQTIDWALSRKGTQKHTEDLHTVSHNIIRFLKELQQGRNIGIPQGSMLFDLIAETILCYADLLLSEALDKMGIKEGYEILRYRDDYKIFCNSKDVLEKISYTLQHILDTLNFRMNSSKTFISDSIITDTIKPDKLFYIYNTPIFNKKGCDFDGIQKHLLYILMFGRKYPNSGQLRTMLNDLDSRIEKKLKDSTITLKNVRSINISTGEEGDFQKEVTYPGQLHENIRAMSAICVQIAIENITITQYVLRVISRMVSSMNDDQQKQDIITKVRDRLINLPNSTYSKLWLQNMTLKQDRIDKKCPYDSHLCRLAMREEIALWNNSWLKEEFTDKFPQASVVNEETVKKVGPVIKIREVRTYEELMNSNFDEI